MSTLVGNLLGSKGGGIALSDQFCQSHVSFTLEANVSSQAERCGIPSGNTSDGVDIGNIDLDSSVFLGGDQSVGPGAFTGDVQVHVDTVFVLHCDGNLLVKSEREMNDG